MLMNLYQAIDRKVVQFDFAVASKDKCDYDDEIESLGGQIIHYPKYVGKNHFEYRKWWNCFFQSHPEYKIVHGHIGSTAAIYLKIARKYGCYTIAHSHNADFGPGLHGLMYRIYSYPTRFIADYFMGCSTEAAISRYGKKVATDKNRCCVLNNGIDITKYIYSPAVCEAVRNEFGISKETLVVGTVGRLTKQKNPLFIIDILAELRSKTDDFIFLWAGTGEMKDEIISGLELKGVRDKVILLGVRNDIPRILQALNVFVLPSLFEGLPVVGVEVQAAGVPMLCSDTISPEVKVTECVTFIPNNSAELWASKIMEEKSFRRDERAPEDVKKAGYDIQTTSSWLESFYESANR